MALDTSTDVERVRKVKDSNGNDRPPANADNQKAPAGRFTNKNSVRSYQVTPSSADTEEAGPDKSVPTGKRAKVKAHPDNTGPNYVGGTSNDVAEGAVIPLEPGESLAFAVGNLSKVKLKTGTQGDTFTLWMDRDQVEVQ